MGVETVSLEIGSNVIEVEVKGEVRNA